MGEHRHDLFHMMRHQHQRGRVFLMAQPLDELQEMLPCRRVQPRARFVQDEQARMRHQRPADQHPLAFALREHLPRPVRQIFALHLPQQLRRLRLFRAAHRAPEIDHRVLAARHRFQRRLVIRHHLPHGGTHDAHLFAQFPPVITAVRLPEQRHLPRRRHEIPRQRAQQRGFAGPVGPQHHPVLPRFHPPVHRAQNGRAPALDVQPGNVQHRGQGLAAGLAFQIFLHFE